MAEKHEKVLEKFQKYMKRQMDIHIDAVVREGHPPEEALRDAVVTLLRAVADHIERSNTKRKIDWFPMEFPMMVIFESEATYWDFMLTATLMNRYGVEENP